MSQTENMPYPEPGIRGMPKRQFASFLEPLLEDLGTLNLCGIDWVIVGGESGPGARPMRKQWVLSLRNQCKQASVPLFSNNGVAFAKARQDAA